MKLTPRQLAKKLETTGRKKEKALAKIYAKALHGHERINDIIDRLGFDNTLVLDYVRARNEYEVTMHQAKQRVGPMAEVHVMNALLNQGRKVKTIRGK